MSLDFDNWAPGFPTGQQCVSLNLHTPHHGLWQDVPCLGSDEAALLFGVCEAASCVQRTCDPHAKPDNSSASETMCVDCVCDPGWAGPGYLCGPDTDNDGWSDLPLDCEEPPCAQDNCVGIPNSGQEDADGDGIGDSCDNDSDNDLLVDSDDNCPLVYNPGQEDGDGDGVGDACDNCIGVSNPLQENQDNDEYGDACDDDIDNDAILNGDDNCPYVENPDQVDSDSDGVGDKCDSCRDVYNPDQEDANHNNIGDACDDGIDTDHDGIPDSQDNCPSIPNSNQLDSDDDGFGDVCDNDADNDGVANDQDNCPLVFNPDQTDSDGDGVGDKCENDCDGDTVLDPDDVCPCNTDIQFTDFRAIQAIEMGENSYGQPPPRWLFADEGKEIHQYVNSAPGIAIGDASFAGVEFRGTFFVGDNYDHDWLGSIFAFQVSNSSLTGTACLIF